MSKTVIVLGISGSKVKVTGSKCKICLLNYLSQRLKSSYDDWSARVNTTVLGISGSKLKVTGVKI